MSNDHEQEAHPEQSLAQVRELLFGSQSRDFEKRCHQLEEQMSQSYQALRHDLGEQLKQMQKQLRDEIANVRGQVATEQADRQQGLDQLGERLDKTISEQGSELQHRIGGVHDELRTYTLNQTQHLWDDMQSRYDNLSSRMDQEINEVRAAATQRSSLGDMFREMATRLEEHSQAEQS